MIDELKKLIPDIQPDIQIEERDITRICHACNKPYKDKQIVVNGVPSCSFALCSNCRNTYIRDYCERLNNEKCEKGK